MLLKKLVLPALFLALSFNAHSQTDIGGVHVKTFVEDFNYETLTGTIRVESFVEKDIKKPSDIVLVVDVSSSMSNEVTLEEFTARSSQTYKPSTYSSRNTYYYLYEGEYCQVGRVYDDDYDEDVYNYLYFTYNNSRYYLSGTGATTINPKKFDPSFTGVLYEKSTINLGTRLALLKNFLEDFIDSVSENEDNRIAVVSYSNTATTVLGLTSVAGTGASTVKNAVTGLSRSTSGTRNIDQGIGKASSIISGISDKVNREQVVVVFTNGAAPTTSSNKVANDAISGCKTLKDDDVTVFSVSLLANTSTTAQNMMNYMSSNYPAATSLSSYGANASSDYYYNSPDGTELGDAYSAIADEINSWTLDFDGNTKMKDAFLSDIEITTDKSQIKAYTAACSGYSSNNYTFSTSLAPLSGLDVEVSTDSGTGKQNVAVGGYDFTENQCYSESDNYHGKQLVLRIPFTFTPTAEHLDDDRFTLTINDDSALAGIYLNDSRVAKAMSSGVPFASLIIHKDGLIENESAIFTIERQKSGTETANTHVNRVVMTGTSEDGTTRISHTQRMLDPEATYVVKEHAGWSWTYKPAEAVGTDGFVTQTKKMTTSGATPYLIFKNTKYAEDKLPGNDEDFNN